MQHEISKINVDAILRESNYQSSIYELQKQEYEQAATAGYDFYIFQRDKLSRRDREITANARAAFGGSGVDVNTGSAKLIDNYNKYVHDHNFAWNNYNAELTRHRLQRAADVKGFEGQQALRLGKERAKAEKRLGAIRKRSAMMKAQQYGAQLPWLDLSQNIGIGKDLLALGDWHTKSEKAGG